MKTTKRILSVLMAAVLALTLGVCALAEGDGAEDGWRYVPTSPEGLEDGDIWFDFTYLFEGATPEEIETGLAYFNAGQWYVNLEEHLVKCVSDNALNGVYTRSQQPYILCIKEIGVSWVDVHKNLAGLQVGDYYIDEAVFRSECIENLTELFLEQAIRSYENEHDGESPADEQIAQMRQALADQVEENVVDMYWREYSFSYNPHGTFYRYMLNMLPVPWGYYIVDYAIARQMMIMVDALDASIRVADAAAVAASPWVRVASCIEDAEEGGYYMDFRDPQALAAAFDMAEPPTQEEINEEIPMFESGEWYADFNRGVVTGRITEPAQLTGAQEDITVWLTEDEHLFRLLKVKPVSEPETPTEPEPPVGPEPPVEPTQPGNGGQSSQPSFLQRLTDLFNRIVNFFRNLFRR